MLYYRCQQWLQAAQRIDLINQSLGYLSHHLALCSNHFTKDQFATKDRRILKQNAVPSIFNGSPNNEGFMNFFIILLFV